MMKFHWGFNNQEARRSFWILLTGTLCIFAASLSVFGVYLTQGRAGVISPGRLTYQIVKTIRLAKALDFDETPAKTARALRRTNLRVRITAEKPEHALIIQEVNAKQIRQYIAAQRHHYFRMGYLLPNGQWLTVMGYRPDRSWLLIGIVTAGIVLLLGLIALCIGVVRRMSLPLSTLAEAAQRFGRDIQSPPLAESGAQEMREVIRAFNEMQGRIRRLIMDRTQMLAAISHDLRTPITRLQLRAEYLKGTNQYDKAVADLKEMETMIASILSFARDYVRSESTERFDINVLLETLCDELVDMGSDVIYHGNSERTPFVGRISALKRAFSNLIQNAVKYGDKAEVELKKIDEQLHIKITDHGPGIPEKEMEKVFAPFYRIDSSRSLQKSGTGLGLSVARDIILGHGGEIKLYNVTPKGLTVLVTLPISV